MEEANWNTDLHSELPFIKHEHNFIDFAVPNSIVWVSDSQNSAVHIIGEVEEDSSVGEMTERQSYV